jgi:hypothetical protein
MFSANNQLSLSLFDLFISKISTIMISYIIYEVSVLSNVQFESDIDICISNVYLSINSYKYGSNVYLSINSYKYGSDSIKN